MTILSLLIALAVERVTIKQVKWQGQDYAQRMYNWLHEKQWISPDVSSVHWFLTALIPAMLISIIISLLPGSFFEFIVQTIVLFICLGSQTLRSTYKCFLQAANRGDYEACYLFSQQMGHCDTKPDQAKSFGLRLVWLNYQYYGGVVIAFIAFGAAGAVFYTLIREAFEYACASEDYTVSAVAKARHMVDWVPVRVCSLGMLLVGNFTHALPIWLGALVAFQESAVSTLTRVSAAAEVLPDNQSLESDPTLEPSILVKLAKRNMMFILVCVSLLTVFGIL